MGKGDKKTTRGKIYRGSHGNVRKRALKKSTAPARRTTSRPAVGKKPAAAKKTAPRKKAT